MKKIFERLLLFFFTLYSCFLSAETDPRELYINLLKKCISNTIYCNDIADMNMRENGKDYPDIAHTMIGLKRLNNIEECLKDILDNDIPGDVIETGVWRGGACIFMKGILKAYGDTSRIVWVADSFEGLPSPDSKKYPDDKIYESIYAPELEVSEEKVRENFCMYDLLDENVVFIKGFFKDTLHKASINQLSLLRLDGDMYQSTMDALNALYPKVSKGGYVIVDDYGAIEACKRAVTDYRKIHKIEEPLISVDWTGVYWKKLSD